jgi:hypothetical protein
MEPNQSNIFVCTVGAWKDYEHQAFVFRKSAERQNIPVYVISKCGQWNGFIRQKVFALLRTLKSVRAAHWKYVLFSDARDSFFTDSIETIACRYRELNIPGKVLFSSELPGRTFPYYSDEWCERIESHYGNGGAVNAGSFIGQIDDVIILLETITKIHKSYLENPSSLPNTLRKDYESIRRDCFWSEQFFLQCLQYAGSPLIHTDTTKHLFALWLYGFPNITQRRVLVNDPLRDIGLACILHSPKRFREEPERCKQWAVQQGVITDA